MRTAGRPGDARTDDLVRVRGVRFLRRQARRAGIDVYGTVCRVLHPLPGDGGARPEVGVDLHVSVTVSFADAVHGVERQVLVTRQVTCGRALVVDRLLLPRQCRQCRGAGHVRWARGHMVFAKPCAACGGEGRQTRERCAVCDGQGSGVRGEAVSVESAGIIDGGRLRVMERDTPADMVAVPAISM